LLLTGRRKLKIHVFNALSEKALFEKKRRLSTPSAHTPARAR